MDGDNGDETPVGLHTDGDEDSSPMGLSQAIQSGGARSVSRVLSDMTFDERREKLKEAYTVPADEHSSPPGTMLPIFHAAHSGTLDVFTAVCGALQSTLDEDEASARASHPKSRYFFSPRECTAAVSYAGG